jgi:UDP-glucose 4-epimerase
MDEFLALAYMQERGLPVTIVRLFNTVGPRQTGQFGMVLPRFIQSARSGKPLRIYGDGLQTRCFCYVGDTVEALVRLSNCPKAPGEVFNVGNDEVISIRDLAERVREAVGSSSPLELVPYETALAPGFEDMRHRRPLLTKLESAIGFRPRTPVQETIRRMVEAVSGTGNGSNGTV